MVRSIQFSQNNCPDQNIEISRLNSVISQYDEGLRESHQTTRSALSSMESTCVSMRQMCEDGERNLDWIKQTNNHLHEIIEEVKKSNHNMNQHVNKIITASENNRKKPIKLDSPKGEKISKKDGFQKEHHKKSVVPKGQSFCGTVLETVQEYLGGCIQFVKGLFNWGL